MQTINLWECLTYLESIQRKDPYEGPPRAAQAKQELTEAARWNGQEITLEATAEGWLIRVFSCYQDDSSPHGIEILIPQERSAPVKILKDRCGLLEHTHA